MNTIFIESSETLGLLYNRYCNIPKKISNFLDKVDKTISYSVKNGVPSNEENTKLNEDLNTFKKDIEIDIKNPDPVDIRDVKKMRSKIQNLKTETVKLLDHLGKIRHKYRYGDNAIKGVIIKPKVYQNTMDGDKLDNVNKWMRISGRCMDWAEKYIMDLLNLEDQDLNLLTLMDKVYFRTIFENGSILDITPNNLFDMEIDHKCIYERYLEDIDELDDDNIDLFNEKIKEDEEFYPVFNVVYSYDFDKWQEANEDQRACIKRGKAISTFTKGDIYSHTLVSFDTSFEHMYHFIGNGFNPDSIYTNPATEVTKSIYVNVSFVTKEEKDIIMDQIKNHKEFKDKTAYSIKILIDQFLGKTNHIDKTQICSTFVGYLLACGNIKNLPRDYSLIRPEDITILPRSFYVMTFKNRDDFKSRQKEFDKKVKKIYEDNIDEIKEYNNILPKVVIKDKLKKKGTIDNVVEWFAKKLTNKNKEEIDEN